MPESCGTLSGGKLAVPSVVGVMMGTWFLASAYSSYVAAQML